MEINLSVDWIASSMIDTISFHWEETDTQVLMDYPHNVKGLLRITFKNNSHYKYPEVALLDVLQIVASDSIGTTFHDIIVKKGYKHVKITPIET